MLDYLAGCPQHVDMQPAALPSLQLWEAAVSGVFCLAPGRLSLLYYTSGVARG